jgi:hypothetical protein
VCVRMCADCLRLASEGGPPRVACFSVASFAALYVRCVDKLHVMYIFYDAVVSRLGRGATVCGERVWFREMMFPGLPVQYRRWYLGGTTT